MNSLKILACCLPALLGCHSGNAQLHFSSMQDIWQYADQHNGQIRNAQTAKEAAGVSVKQAYGTLLPGITGNGSYTDNLNLQPTLVPAGLFNPSLPAGTYTEVTFGRRYIYNANIVTQLNILNLGDWFRIRTAKTDLDIASINIDRARKQLYEQLANAAYTYTLLLAASDLARQNVRTAESMYELASQKFKEGLTSEITLNTAEINVQRAAKSLETALANQSLQLNNLRVMLNTSDSVTVNILPATGANNQPEAGFFEDPDISLARAQLRQSHNQQQAARAAFAPTLSAIYQWNSQVVADQFLDFSQSNTLPQQFWGLRLSVPLFAGASRNFQLRKAGLDLSQKRSQLADIIRQSALTDENLRISFANAASGYEKSKRVLQLYQDNDLHAQRRLQEGILSMDDRLRYYSDLISSQNEYLQSMSDYYIALYHLQIRQINFNQ